MTRNSPLVLAPAQVEDVPYLVDIEFAAFREEKANQQLSYRDASNPRHRIRAMKAYRKAITQSRLDEQCQLQSAKLPVSMPRSDSVVDLLPLLADDQRPSDITFTKVVDTSTGEIVAFSKTERTAFSMADLLQPLDIGHEDEPEVNRAWFALNERLHREFNRTRKHCYFGMLATHPDHQRRGAGTMLLEAILANNTDVDTYLEATGTGRPLYERHGFEATYEMAFDPAKYGVDIGIERQTVMIKRAVKAV